MVPRAYDPDRAETEKEEPKHTTTSSVVIFFCLLVELLARQGKICRLLHQRVELLPSGKHSVHILHHDLLCLGDLPLDLLTLLLLLLTTFCEFLRH
jgi:hypothetical protein